MGRLEVTMVTTAEEMREALAVRRRVFIEEQGVAEEIEIDQYDAEPGTVTGVAHVIGRLSGRAIATGRLLLESDDGHAHIGRVAVLREFRGQGYGRELMLALHALGLHLGVDEVTLAAQVQAIGFYERLGYKARGDVFLDAGIEHRWMDIELQAAC